MSRQAMLNWVHCHGPACLAGSCGHASLLSAALTAGHSRDVHAGSGANFTVGSIFGCWAGKSPVGQSAGSQVAAAYSLYGPQTQVVIAWPAGASRALHAACGCATPASSRVSLRLHGPGQHLACVAECAVLPATT